MKIVIFEDRKYDDLLPLVYFRPPWELRCGILTLSEKIEALLQENCYYLARPYLADYYLDGQRTFSNLPADEEILLINGRWIMNSADVPHVKALEKESVLFKDEDILALRATVKKVGWFLKNGVLDSGQVLQHLPAASLRNIPEAAVLRYPWEAIARNGEEIERDYRLLNQPGKIEGNVYPGTHILHRSQVTIGKDALIKPGTVIDAENGPVWIEEGVTVMPNSVLAGPLCIGKNSTVKIGAKIYGNTSIGPVCKIGGEVEGSIILGYSNKQHDGFLGHSYLGSWINLGADTNNSDLKNNYGFIRVPVNGRPVDTGQRFVGLIMGDHSKCAINTMFNTGTVIGVSCNIFGAGMPPKFMPSFSWGGADGLSLYEFEKALEVAKTVTGRRKIPFGEREEKLFAAARDLAKQAETGTLL